MPHRLLEKKKLSFEQGHRFDGLLARLQPASLPFTVMENFTKPPEEPTAQGPKPAWINFTGESLLYIIFFSVGIVALALMSYAYVTARGATPLGITTTQIFAVLMFLGSIGSVIFWRNKRGQQAVLGVIAVGVALIAAGGSLLPEVAIWGWVFAALPALLVAYHGIYLGLGKPRLIPEELHITAESVQGHLKELIEANDRYFSPTNIGLRYGLPSIVILAVGAIVFYVLNPATDLALEKTLKAGNNEEFLLSTLEAARFGALGAYVYVLLYLSQRCFRRDITSGSAFWCAVTLALGPIFAAIVARVLDDAPGDRATWPTYAAYFLVGLSPRHIAKTVEHLSRRLSLDPSKYMPSDRGVPLPTIRGITLHIEERLVEEGIFDVAGLAMADPLRLQRNTNFDKHQILGWIDAALLIHAIPHSWSELEKRGVRGATDLTWYVRYGKELDARLEGLAQPPLTKDLLRDIAERLLADVQVQRIIMLRELNFNNNPSMPIP